MPNTKNGKKRRLDNKGRKLPDGWSQRPDGRYQSRFTYKGKRYCLYDMDWENLKRKEVALKNSLYMNQNLKSGKVSLNEWYEAWMKTYKEKTLKYSTLNNYKRLWKNHIEPDLGKEKLIEIAQMDVVNFYNRLQGKGMSSGSIKNVHSLMNAVMRSAVANRLIYYNPVDDALAFLKEKDIKKKKEPLTEEEEKIFFDSLKHSNGSVTKYYAMFSILFLTGLRAGELAALQWTDLDYENHTIHINKNLFIDCDVETKKQRKMIGIPKNEYSIRTVPMTEQLEENLKRLKKEQLLNGQKCKENIDGYQNFIFLTNRGNTYSAKTIYSLLLLKISEYNKKEKKRAEKDGTSPILLREFSPHIIRHTFATRCYENGVELHCLQFVIGHAEDSKVTHGVYIHKDKTNAVNMVRKVANQIFNSQEIITPGIHQKNVI